MNIFIEFEKFLMTLFREMKKQKVFKSFQNIKRKYFKNNTLQPNFLTYFEKQQIKSLHEKSPKEWTPQTLSMCFPASPEIICVNNFKYTYILFQIIIVYLICAFKFNYRKF